MNTDNQDPTCYNDTYRDLNLNPGFWVGKAEGVHNLVPLFPNANDTSKIIIGPNNKDAVKYDEGKTDWSLVPFESLEEVIKVLEFGAKKYNEPGKGPDTWNWAKNEGLGKWRTLSAVFRHLSSFAKGEERDKESGLSHLAHAACGLLFLIHYKNNPHKYK